MSAWLLYKGYRSAPISFDLESGLFSGTVLGLSDAMSFEGRTPGDLQDRFRDSIDSYLELCAARGEEPERPCKDAPSLPLRHLAVTYADRPRASQPEPDEPAWEWTNPAWEQAVKEGRPYVHVMPFPPLGSRK